VRDFGMLTCDPQIGEDLTELFNFLTSGQAIQRTANCYPHSECSNRPRWMRLRARSRGIVRIRPASSVQDERAGRQGYHPGALPGIAVRGQGRPHRS